jgi:hypothetical protein
MADGDKTEMVFAAPAPPPEHGLGDDTSIYLQELDTAAPPPSRRRVGAVTVLLAAALVAAAGFFGGVKVEKSRVAPASNASSFAAARTNGRTTTTVEGASGARGANGATGGAGAGGAGAAGGAGGGFGGAGGGGVAGTVKLVDGANVYVTDAQGNVVKIVTNAGSTVTKTVEGTVADIHPGDTVIVQGQDQADGSVAATRVVDNGAGGAAGGLGGFGGRGGARGGGGGAGATGATGGAPQGG